MSAALLVIGFVVGLTVGRARPQDVRSNGPAKATLSAESSVDGRGSGPTAARQVGAFSTTRVVRALVPDAGVARAATAAERQQAADALVVGLVVRLRAGAQSAVARGVGPEDLANEQNYYLDGWIDSVLTLSQDRLPQLSHAIDEAMCNAQSDGEAIVFSRLTARVPELATTHGLGCILAAHHEEDAVLANALDAYRRAGLPPSPAWEAWRARATTPEIQWRFQPWGVDPPERASGLRGTVVQTGRDGRDSAR